MARKHRPAARSKSQDPLPEGFEQFANQICELIRTKIAEIDKLKAQL